MVVGDDSLLPLCYQIQSPSHPDGFMEFPFLFFFFFSFFFLFIFRESPPFFFGAVVYKWPARLILGVGAFQRCCATPRTLFPFSPFREAELCMLARPKKEQIFLLKEGSVAARDFFISRTAQSCRFCRVRFSPSGF